jgi:uncharacterized membrane protein
MGNVRNWAPAVLVAAVILLGPVIAFVIFLTVEMLTDLVTKVGATAVWPVVAGAMGWVLLRKFGGQAHTSQLRSEGA